MNNNPKRYFEGNNIDEIYLDLIREISTNPEHRVSPRGMAVKETNGVVVRLTNPRKCLVTLEERKLNYAFTIIEKLEYISGRHNAERIEFYNSNFSHWKNDLGYFDGAYGP